MAWGYDIYFVLVVVILCGLKGSFSYSPLLYDMLFQVYNVNYPYTVNILSLWNAILPIRQILDAPWFVCTFLYHHSEMHIIKMNVGELYFTSTSRLHNYDIVFKVHSLEWSFFVKEICPHEYSNLNVHIQYTYTLSKPNSFVWEIEWCWIGL